MHLKRGSKTLGMLTNEIKPGILFVLLLMKICIDCGVKMNNYYGEQ
ncbi:MAG: hypothetical protein ACCK35_01185 [Candidatus Karelsulcia muelleri]